LNIFACCLYLVKKYSLKQVNSSFVVLWINKKA
jgi:hypothetical protein